MATDLDTRIRWAVGGLLMVIGLGRLVSLVALMLCRWLNGRSRRSRAGRSGKGK